MDTRNEHYPFWKVHQTFKRDWPVSISHNSSATRTRKTGTLLERIIEVVFCDPHLHNRTVQNENKKDV